jgi:iron complex outermembrane receptor protein
MCAGAILYLLLALQSQPQTGPTAADLKKLSIEELTELDITTASRRAEPLARTAAAVSVLRGEDFRRAGVTSLAEALRLADGVIVARADNETWAISARGFDITTANKLLVLIDGRTVYSPLFAGTFWSIQDVPLDDIDRIEVTRGPGGAVWGGNAVNGVVNIITKSASETQGVSLLAGGGTEERAIGTLQYGGSRTRFAYRLYGKYRERDGGVLQSGADANDPVKYGQAGFRLDSRGSTRDRWTVQGDAYDGSEGLYNHPSSDVNGANVLARWTRTFSPASSLTTQVYYDHVFRHVVDQVQDRRDTFDVDTQQQFVVGRHSLLAGGGFRVSRGDDTGYSAFFFDPAVAVTTLGGVFAQDEITLVPTRFAVIVGAKVERASFSGFETQPTVRLRWTPSARQTVWTAVSRGVRLPTRFDTDLRFDNPATGVITLTGSRDFDTEKVMAYEGGYRASRSRASIDVATYTNRYDDLRSEEFPASPGQPIRLANLLNANTYGAELAGTVAILRRWRTHASYTYLHEHFFFDSGSNDLTKGFNEFNDPSHLFSWRSSIDLPRRLEGDVMFRHVAALPHPVVPAYSEMDARVGWRRSQHFEISLVGQNLLHAYHPEFQLASPTREEFQRGAFVRFLWSY